MTDKLTRRQRSKKPARRQHPKPLSDWRLDPAIDLVQSILDFAARADPAQEAKSEEDKDLVAGHVLWLARRLVQLVAGWAVDHQVGLALAGLEWLGIAHPKLVDSPEFTAAKTAVDSHEHQRIGASLYSQQFSGDGELLPPRTLDAATERRILANLLELNPGAFPDALARRAVEALRALDHGEVHPLFEPAKTGEWRNAYSRSRLELRALEFVEFRHARGTKRYMAQKEVAAAYGQSPETVRTWSKRLRDKLGRLAVNQALAFARTAGRNSLNAAQEDEVEAIMAASPTVYGDQALGEAGRAYRDVISVYPARPE